MIQCRVYDTREFHECSDLGLEDDVNNLVGVSQDKGDGNCIVSYPHCIIRYKLMKEKSIHEVLGEWVTKYNLTSAAVYDAALDKYIGVFHTNTVRVWGHETRDLELADKYTFRIPITTIVTRRNNDPLLIFANGDCVTLSYGIIHHKKFNRKALLKKSSKIVDVATYTRVETDYVCYIVKDEKDFYYIITFPLENDVCDSSKVNTVKVSNARQVKQGPVRVTGKKIVVSSEVNPVAIFTWSDSCISVYNVIKKSWKHKLYRYMFDKFQSEVNMACIGKNFFAFFIKGYVPKEAAVLIPHIHIAGFQWTTWERSYRQDAKVYSIGQFVVVADAQRIAVLHVIAHTSERPD